MSVGSSGFVSCPRPSVDAYQSFSPLSRIAFSKNEKWIEYLFADLKEKVNHLLKIWDDIGLDEKPYEERKCILKRHLDMLLDNMISEEERSVAHLHSVVDEMEVKVSKLNSILGLKEKPLQHNLPLIVRERNLAEAYKHLSVMVSSRIDRFRSLAAEHQRLSKALGRPLKHYTYDYAPSPQLLEAIEHDINELLIKLAQRYAETCNHKVSNQVIESDATTGKNDDFTLSSGTCDENSTNTSISTFLSLKKRVAAIRESAQTERLKEAIRSNLLDLHKLFDECLVDPCIRELYPLDPNESSLDEVYLEHLENQIKDWQDYRTLHTDAIAAFYSWRASFARLLQVEGQLYESKHLPTQSKDLFKLEREATSIRERILPQLEKLLFSVAHKSEDFKVFGLPAKVYVEEARREADRAPPGTQRLSPEKQAQLLSKSVMSLRTSNATRAGNYSRKSILKPNQSPKSAISTVRARSGGANLRPGSYSRFKSPFPDKNQSASAVFNSAALIDQKPAIQKVEWLKLRDEVGASGSPSISSISKAAALSRLRAPRVMVDSASKNSGFSASCGRLRHMTLRAVRLLAESPRPISVIDLFGCGGNKPAQASSGLKTPTGLGASSTKTTVSWFDGSSSLGDLTSSYSSLWVHNRDINLGTHQPVSPTSVKSDSIFATPIGRAPTARKKGTTTPKASASCSYLNRLTPRAVPLPKEPSCPVSVVDLFRHRRSNVNRLTPMGNSATEIENRNAPGPKNAATSGWQPRSDKATTSQDASNDRMITSSLSSFSSSSVLKSNQSVSPTSTKGETIFVTPVGRAPVARRLQKMDSLHTTPSTPTPATPSRLRTPRVVTRFAAVTPTLLTPCSRLDQMTPRALPLPKEPPRTVSVVNFFRRDGERDATNGTPLSRWRTRRLRTPNDSERS